MAYAILDYSKEEAELFANAIIDAKETIKRCKHCFNFSENVPSAPTRNVTEALSASLRMQEISSLSKRSRNTTGSITL